MNNTDLLKLFAKADGDTKRSVFSLVLHYLDDDTKIIVRDYLKLTV